VAKQEKKPAQSGVNGRPTVSWAHAFRDIIITSMNKGQLPLLAFAGVIAVLVWRMPAADIPALIDRILTRLESGELLGWLLTLLLVIGWYTHARWLRREYAEEFERIGREKSRLQEGAAGRRLQGSQARR
jgi:hypothetical protein